MVVMKEFFPTFMCSPKASNILSRRFNRSSKDDNELYRSNSFKFERFERNMDNFDGSRTLRQQVSH